MVALTLADPPVETTDLIADLMARASGISASAVRRIWKAHGLQLHRDRQFKLSNDSNFVDKLRDVVGLYVDPPAHAIALSLDEKSQPEALDRTEPGLPLEEGPVWHHERTTTSAMAPRPCSLRSTSSTGPSSASERGVRTARGGAWIYRRL